MFSSISDKEPPSCKERLTRWLPSMPSVPSIPSWKSCKEAFGSLTYLFQSSNNNFSNKSKEDLTSLEFPDLDLEYLEELPEESKRETPSKVRYKCLLYFTGMATISAASCVFLYYSQSQKSESSDEKTSVSTALANHSVTHMMEAGQAIGHLSRTILASIPLTLANCTIFGTEEIPMSQSFNTWDFFPTEQGRLIVSTSSKLPPGVNLVQTPIRIINTLNFPNSGTVASKGNHLYVASSQTNAIQIWNMESLSNPYWQFVLDAGTITSNMAIREEKLFISGNGTLLKSFDISNPFKPILQGAAVNTSVTGYAFASAGQNNQFGVATTNGFFYVNATDFSITGMIPNMRVTSMRSIAASEDGYFVGSQAGLYSVSANPSSAPISLLPLTGISSVIYENGYCIVGTTSQLLIINVQDPSNMQIAYASPSGTANSALALLSHGNLLYYTNYALSGLGIIDKSNITNPVFSANNLIPEAKSGNLFLHGNNIIIKQGDTAYFATNQDSFSFSGTPTGGSQGNYPIELRATNFNGQFVDQTLNCNYVVNPVITASKSLPNLVVGANQPVSTYVPDQLIPNAFTHQLGLSKEYELICESVKIQNALDLNSVSGQFRGTPKFGDVGTTTCMAKAKDSLSAFAMTNPFNVSITYGPTLDLIPQQIAIKGQLLSINLTATSRDHNSTFTFSAENLSPSVRLMGNHIEINSTETEVSHTIPITVKDQHGISDTKSVFINVKEPAEPIFDYDVPSQTMFTGQPFETIIPLARSANGPSSVLTHTLTFADGSPLREWMKVFIGSDKIIVRGTPPVSEKFYNDVNFRFKVTATDSLPNNHFASKSIYYNSLLTGNSVVTNLRNILIASPIAGFIWTRRVKIHNKWAKIECKCMITTLCVVKAFLRIFCISCPKSQYKKGGSKELIKGESYEFQNSRDLKKFQTFISGTLYAPSRLPPWINPSVNKSGRLEIKLTEIPDEYKDESISIASVNEYLYESERITFNPVSTKNEIELPSDLKVVPI